MFVEALTLGFVWYLGLFPLVTRQYNDTQKIREAENRLHLFYYSSTCFVAFVFYSEDLLRWITVEKYVYGVTPESFSLAFCGVQVGVYLAMLFAIRIEPVKRDVRTMTIHHILTAATVALCALQGHAHACVVILLLHDLCDIPLLAMVMAGKRDLRLLEGIFYCLLVAGFVLLRLICFPWVCFEAARADFKAATPLILAINGGLWLMHVYWLRKILQQGYRRLTGKTTFDDREEPKTD